MIKYGYYDEPATGRLLMCRFCHDVNTFVIGTGICGSTLSHLARLIVLCVQQYDTCQDIQEYVDRLFAMH